MIELLPFKPIHGMALMDDIAQEIPRRLLWVLGTEKWNEIAALSEGRAWTGRRRGRHLLLRRGDPLVARMLPGLGHGVQECDRHADAVAAPRGEVLP